MEWVKTIIFRIMMYHKKKKKSTKHNFGISKGSYNQVFIIGEGSCRVIFHICSFRDGGKCDKHFLRQWTMSYTIIS